ncbi:MAG: CHASE domain-containing protein [Halioglobus sp.]|nr:CHASE domain-containing protein [Halioglobus sp.]
MSNRSARNCRFPTGFTRRVTGRSSRSSAYIDPLDEANIQALGFDIFSNPVARRAAEEARDAGQIVITEPLALAQDESGGAPTSFVMYLPVYNDAPGLDTVAERRRALVGWVDVPFRMRDLMAHLSAALNPGIDIEIHDSGLAGEAGLLYRTDAVSHRQRAAAGELQTEFADRRGDPPVAPAAQQYTPISGEYGVGGGLLPGCPLRHRPQCGSGTAGASRRHQPGQEPAPRRPHGRPLSTPSVRSIRPLSAWTKIRELFPLVCRMAVDYGGMAMAWIRTTRTAIGTSCPSRATVKARTPCKG